MSEREKGCMVTRLNKEGFIDCTIEDIAYSSGKTKESLVGLRPMYDWAFFKDWNGYTFAVCSEGVGSKKPVSKLFPLRIEYISGDEIGTTILTTIPEVYLGQMVDLADFIRTFGSRLDSNHWEWFKFYKSNNCYPLVKSAQPI
jgi:hypothetical protein